ncbi:papain-like cysteine protease family protein [Amycolatopsis sp. PS_44_ISF1]|uniref:papain-like cysteine protease family protein n=1 Tax=Amycolatopsis sp. PS_44_ISF1 TaxID=2974917 RepID=UPI0028DDC887|nr:papain-like cysteine protease family protein [Amycolatopsis sp. PS_44_ISF1]MDT8915205.1 C39 family peptidase [Amycolatopsis sp. PS_44_ISF1]
MERHSRLNAFRAAAICAGTLLAALTLVPAAVAETGSRPEPGAAPSGMIVTPHASDVQRFRLAPGAVSNSARPYSKLNYTQQKQTQNEWCWAADGSSVEQFFGAGTTQSQFCAAGKGTSVGNCPNDPAYMSEVARGLHNTGFSGTAIQDAISFREVQNEINAGEPIITQVDWSSGGGHARVFYGYDSSAQTLNFGDPWPSYQRYQTMNYNDYLQNGDFTWSNTVYGIDKQ